MEWFNGFWVFLLDVNDTTLVHKLITISETCYRSKEGFKKHRQWVRIPPHLKNEDEAFNNKATLDRCILRLIASCCNGDKLVRATELVKLLSLEKSVRSAIKLVIALKLPNLAERFNTILEVINQAIKYMSVPEKPMSEGVKNQTNSAKPTQHHNRLVREGICMKEEKAEAEVRLRLRLEAKIFGNS
ncbi:hypothetical protein L6452_34496 [Arctium lappa]|uniref:Uncharacterized protein n=1 Tax=Arctium lappa TaxID=4217 RepID=A0ACB8YJ38_ARCLA|nr:hypothetical protein L6452_34496 [Arctium lappa]